MSLESYEGAESVSDEVKAVLDDLVANREPWANVYNLIPHLIPSSNYAGVTQIGFNVENISLGERWFYRIYLITLDEDETIMDYSTLYTLPIN